MKVEIDVTDKKTFFVSSMTNKANQVIKQLIILNKLSIPLTNKIPEKFIKEFIEPIKQKINELEESFIKNFDEQSARNRKEIQKMSLNGRKLFNTMSKKEQEAFFNIIEK